MTPQECGESPIPNIRCSRFVPSGRKGIWRRLIGVEAINRKLAKWFEPPAELKRIDAGATDEVPVVFERG